MGKMMYLPEEIYQYKHPEDVNTNELDQDMRGIFLILRDKSGVGPIEACQGHPESTKVEVWGTDIFLRFGFVWDKLADVTDMANDIMSGQKDRFSQGDRGFNIVHGSHRSHRFRYDIEEHDSQCGIATIKYDYDTVGERDVIIDIIETALRNHL